MYVKTVTAPKGRRSIACGCSSVLTAATGVQHSKPGKAKITICVRKRPVNSKEVARKDWDSVSCLNPKVYVHTCKLKVDGITKYLDNQVFAFDHTFGEDDQNEDVYVYTVQPQVAFMFKGGNATCFACVLQPFAAKSQPCAR